MTFEEFQAKVKELIFSKRQIAFKELQGIVSSRHSFTIAWPDVLLFAESEDFDIAYTIASVERKPMMKEKLEEHSKDCRCSACEWH